MAKYFQSFTYDVRATEGAAALLAYATDTPWLASDVLDSKDLEDLHTAMLMSGEGIGRAHGLIRTTSDDVTEIIQRRYERHKLAVPPNIHQLAEAILALYHWRPEPRSRKSRQDQGTNMATKEKKVARVTGGKVAA